MEVREIRQIGEIEREWLALLAQSQTATVFQHPAWVEVWGKYWQNGERLILGVYEREALAAVGVFEVEEKEVRFWGRGKQAGGAADLSDFGDIVSQKGREAKIWRELITAVKRRNQGARIVLDYLREESASCPAAESAGREAGLTVVKESETAAPVVKLGKSWPEYLAGLTRKKRHELERKLRKSGAQECEFKVQTDRLSPQQLGRFAQLMRQGRLKKRDFYTEKMAGFFAEMMNAMIEAGWGRLYYLSKQGEMAAAVFGFERQGVIYLYNGGYDVEAGVYAVGVKLVSEIVRYAINKAGVKIDFLRGEERYKYDVGAQDRQLFRLVFSTVERE